MQDISVQTLATISAVVGSFITGFWGFMRLLINRMLPSEDKAIMLEMEKQHIKIDVLREAAIRNEETMKHLMELNRDYAASMNRLIDTLMKQQAN